MNLLCNFLWMMILIIMSITVNAQKRAGDFGINIGVMKPGKTNSLLDVIGVKVGHETLIVDESVRTGVTAILPHGGNIFQQKVPAAIYIGNGFGKLAGYSQVEELGNLETPIILTNTLSVPTAMNAVISYTLLQEGNDKVRSVNALVGETNDGYLNNIRGRYVNEAHVMAAIEKANDAVVMEGNVGAGTGTTCFRYKGGIGTSSRELPASLGGYTIGVLVQTNFGGVLQIDGVPIAKKMKNYPYMDKLNESSDGSCMIVVATDAPMGSRNLKRLAKRAMLGLGKTGGIATNGSGDYVIAFSTYADNFVPYVSNEKVQTVEELSNDEMSPLFLATIEATEEAIINSLFAAEDMTGHNGNTIKALPIEEVIELMKEYGRM